MDSETRVAFRTVVGETSFVTPRRLDMRPVTRYLGRPLAQPRVCDWCAAKRLTQYLLNTKEFYQHLSPSGPSSLFRGRSDTVWAGDVHTRRCISCCCIFLGLPSAFACSLSRALGSFKPRGGILWCMLLCDGAVHHSLYPRWIWCPTRNGFRKRREQRDRHCFEDRCWPRETFGDAISLSTKCYRERSLQYSEDTWRGQ